MANTAANVVVGISGSVYVGPTSASAPTSSSSTLTGFTDLGYISNDGVTVTPSRNTAQIRAWQNADLVREVVTESDLAYKFVMLEMSAAAATQYFGVAPASNKVAWSPSATGGKQSFVIDMIDGSKVVRHYIPSGEIMKVEPLQAKNGEAISFGVTISAYVTSGRAADVFFSSIS
jgi:hypothetical protein